MKRLFDLFMSLSLLAILFLPMVLIFIIVKSFSEGPGIHRSKRIGKDGNIFIMLKFRTMFIGTPNLASHLLNNSSNCITPFGRFLRKYSLDELPQLLNVIKGEMSFVGPRPALFNQYDLIELRNKKNIHSILPGITGLAQVSGRDDLSIKEKVLLDSEYFEKMNFFLDIKILFITFLNVIRKKNIRH